ncbi:hypothetical protein BC938DRAFT_479604 [Jimgerdemannia flammicorona]|uniref:ML-like domain-containing protein n=1 Tax=Jimgerdemannia flammicorona TaxID=994334 RepID=A0A433QKJ8_9FUNG|nr:hypothetical protein BC938DRAFT_479604 [Jimgerdemannia flammicorona]
MLAHRRAISSLPSLPSLLLLLLLCATVVRASDLDQLYGYNWTLCQNTTTYFNISTVYRHYDPLSKTYNFSIAGYSPVDVNNVSAAYNAIATSYTFARFAFWDTFNDVKALCDSVVTGCPIKKGNITIINKSFRVPGSAFPLGDIQASFRALTGDLQNFTCIDIAPIGYQNPIWRQIFIWVPVGIALFAAMVSIISTLISGPTEDFYVLTSNYALEPIALRLKTPGFFDVLHYAQFIVASGQLSLRYPKFYPLFVSDFAWSSLLFPGEYLNNAAALWYESSSTTPLPDSTAATSNANVPGLSLNKRLLRLWSRQVDSSGPPTVGDSDVPVVVNITGTGMVNFANSVGLDARALFLSVLIYFLMIMAAILVLCLLFLLVVEYLGCWYPYRFAGQRKKIFNFAIDDHVLLPVDASSALVRKPDGLTGPLLPSPGGSGLYRLLPPAPAPAHHHLRRHQPPTQVRPALQHPYGRIFPVLHCDSRVQALCRRHDRPLPDLRYHAGRWYHSARAPPLPRSLVQAPPLRRGYQYHLRLLRRHAHRCLRPEHPLRRAVPTPERRQAVYRLFSGLPSLRRFPRFLCHPCKEPHCNVLGHYASRTHHRNQPSSHTREFPRSSTRNVA